MKKIAFNIAVICSLSAQSQIIHKRKVVYVRSPLRLLLLKDTIAANVYIDLAIAESNELRI
jgi:hypothetical protein